MITFIGDDDWTRKVKRRVPKNIRQDVTIIQLDRAETEKGGYSSSRSVHDAVGVAITTTSLIVLVGSCPRQDYEANNSKLWAKLPVERTHFFDATSGKNELSEFLQKITAPN